MTQAAVLKVTANGTTASPVKRGAWVIGRIVGHPPDPPPGDVPAIEPDVTGATTIREMLAAHRENAACAACHVKIDPPGFALESFDVIGGWQTRYRSLSEIGQPVDKSETYSGRRVGYTWGLTLTPREKWPTAARSATSTSSKPAAERPLRAIARNLVAQLTTYATGSPIDFADRDAVENLLDETATGDFGVRSLIHEIVQSPLFRNRSSTDASSVGLRTGVRAAGATSHLSLIPAKRNSNASSLSAFPPTITARSGRYYPRTDARRHAAGPARRPPAASGENSFRTVASPHGRHSDQHGDPAAVLLAGRQRARLHRFAMPANSASTRASNWSRLTAGRWRFSTRDSESRPSMRNRPLRLLAIAVLCLPTFSVLSHSGLRAEETPPEPPRIAISNPFAVASGSTTKLVIRGWKLDQATEVRCLTEGATVKILSKGTAPVPGRQEAKQVGDTQIEVELTLPEPTATTSSTDAPSVVPQEPASTDASSVAATAPADQDHGRGVRATSCELVIVSPDGASTPYHLLVGASSPVVAEREPNDGFDQAQPVESSQTIDGSTHGDRNVDVFRLEATAGQTVSAEVVAARYGSALDSLLTLYDERGTTLAISDDTDTPDSRLTFRITTSGRYFLVLQDAHDRGGPAHPWRLVLTTSLTPPATP